MFNEDIKVYVPTPEISALVQEKLFEMGYSWMGDKHVCAKNMPHLYAHKDGRILCGGTPSFFEDDESRQVHYLQILTGDLDGVLFRNTVECVTYYESKNAIYWVRNGVLCSLKGYTAEHFLQFDDNVKVDVNEEEIMTNEMPKLEAGKHVIKTKYGWGIAVPYDYGGQGVVWTYFARPDGSPLGCKGWDGYYELILEVHSPNHPNDLFDASQYDESTLIWKRDDKAAKRQKEYDELQRQIAQLQKQADKLQEMDDE